MLIRANDFPDFIANRTWIDLDVIVRRRQLSQERFGDLAIGRNYDLAVLRVYDIERNFFAEQDVRERISQLLDQGVFLALMLFADGFELSSGFCRSEFFAGNFATGRDLYVHHNSVST